MNSEMLETGTRFSTLERRTLETRTFETRTLETRTNSRLTEGAQ
jgi:hypothetical protein